MLTGLGRPTLLAALDLLREGVVDGEDAAVELGAVHVVHGGGGVVALQEGDETEGAVFLGGLVERRLGVLDVAEGGEDGRQDLLVHLLRQTACAKELGWRDKEDGTTPLDEEVEEEEEEEEGHYRRRECSFGPATPWPPLLLHLSRLRSEVLPTVCWFR